MNNNEVDQDHSKRQEQPLHDEKKEEVGCMERFRLSRQKIIKILILGVIAFVIGWFFVNEFSNLIFHAKKFSKVMPDASIEELSGLDQESYRSCYFFREMEKMAKENVKMGKKFDLSVATDRFGDVSFNELLGLFKVVKAIQYAKGYEAFPLEDSREEFSQTIDQEQLDKPYNYTDLMSPASNQYLCLSCYSFPIAATIEYIYKKHFNITVKLSEQQLIDCSSEDDTIDGCNWGNITKGFEYAAKIGLVEQSAYPYRSKTGHSFPCRKEIVDDPKVKKYKIDGFRILPKQNCMAIQYELSRGNVVASMMATGELRFYSKTETTAFSNCNKYPFTHAITIVGQTANQEWIVRNSWGTSFGQNGYFIMKGENTCGVCTHAIVPFFNSSRVGEGGK